MQIKLPFGTARPISGEACVEISRPAKEVFNFIAENFFINYPKWSSDIIVLEPLNEPQVGVGAQGKQVRKENGAIVDSIFEIVEYTPYDKFIFQGITAPYKHTYLMEADENGVPTKLTFRFDLSEIEIFMRPFEKLIQVAIEEGTETTVETIKNLLTPVCN